MMKERGGLALLSLAALGLLIPLTSSLAGDARMTSLDEALKAAYDDPSTQMDFYYRFLGTDLYVPIISSSVPVGAHIRSDENTTISPIILEVDGKRGLPVFDTEDRLASWAEGREVRFVVVRGYVILEILASMPGDYQIALNVGQPIHRIFEIEEVNWLRGISSSMSSEMSLTEREKISISDPSIDVSHLTQALAQEFKAESNKILKAYVVEVSGESFESTGELFIVIILAEEDKRYAESIIKELSPVILQKAPEGKPVNLSWKDDSLLNLVQEKFQPFYVR